MSGPDQLDPAEHERILQQEILAKSDVIRATAQEAPRAIILGGQPGAGKGGLARAAFNDLGSNAVVVDPDALRRFHPRVAEFRSQNPYTWSGRTHPDASQWADELREHVVASRQNLVFDTTLSDGQWISELIQDLELKGYRVEVRAIATPKLESEHGVDHRFSKGIEEDGFGRHVPKGARDAIYDKLPQSLDVIRSETDVPIRIFDRGGIELYSSTAESMRPGIALNEARQARIDDPAIARRVSEDWQRQVEWHRDLPSRLASDGVIDVDGSNRLLNERHTLGIEADVQRNAREALLHNRVVQTAAGVDGDIAVKAAAHEAFAARTAPRLRAGSALGVAGIALTLYDAADTGFSIHRRLHEGNATAGRSEAIHFGGRTLGGLAGAGIGAAAGAAVGVETGPGALVTGAMGGAVGVVAGDKVAAWMDNRTIYNQTDRQGHSWKLDPEHMDRGWRRDAPLDATNDGIDNAHREPLRAAPFLENELNFQATRTSAELILGAPPVPRDPFSQPAQAGDSPSVAPANWVRDADSGSWQRTVTLAYAERGLSPTSTETASPERAAKLDRAAAKTLLDNAENSRPVIAARFEDVYARGGWAAYGPLPEAVREARTNTASLMASDGHRYDRRPDGAWVSHGMLMDSRANGNLREELEATRTVLASRLPPPRAIEPPPPMTAEDRLRDTVVGAYRNAGIDLTPAQVESRARAVGETWRTHGLDPATTALRVVPGGDRLSADSTVESLKLESDGRTYRVEAQTIIDDGPRVPSPHAVDPHAIKPQGPQERQLREDAEHEASRRGLSHDDVQQVSRHAVAMVPAGFAPVRKLPKDLRDGEHPGHAAYGRSLDDVRRMEVSAGIPHGEHSHRLAAAVAIAVEREHLHVQRLDMGKDGQVVAVERGAAPSFAERRVPIDAHDAMSKSMETLSHDWLTARSPHYRNGQPAAERTAEQSQALARLSPSDQAMFARIRGEVPAHVSDDVVAQSMLSAKKEGVRDAQGIDQIVIAGDRLFVTGKIPGQMGMTDMSAPTQAVSQTVAQVESVNQQTQQRDMQMQNQLTQQAQEQGGRARVLS